MKHPSIASIISFCSLDEHLLPYAIEAVRPFSDQILISLCTHRFDGTPEENQKYFTAVPGVTFVEYAFSDRLYGSECTLDREHVLFKHHWHNTSRLVPTYFLDSNIDWVLFLDADEIVDPQRFMQMKWKSPCRLASYWYFREANYRATTWLDSAVMMPKKNVKPEILLHPRERAGMTKNTMVLGQDQKPLIHHYSWVKSKQQMLDKVSCWAHGYETDWKSLIEKEMASDFSGTDFVYGFDYQSVEPFIDPFVKKSFGNGLPAMIHHVTPQTIYNLEVQRCFLTPTHI